MSKSKGGISFEIILEKNVAIDKSSIFVPRLIRTCTKEDVAHSEETLALTLLVLKDLEISYAFLLWRCCVCVCVCMYVYMYMFSSICVCICIYMYM